MTQQTNILLIEDDESLGYILQDTMSWKGHRVEWIKNGNDALPTFQKTPFDLLVVDVNLPGKDGFEVIGSIRKYDTETPIIVLTARAEKEDRLKGLRTGADDYLTKPFSVEELMLRIDNLLRRAGKGKPVAKAKTEVAIGRYMFSPATWRLCSPSGHERTLTQREADLLLFLVGQQGVLVPKEQILLRFWGDDDYFKGRSLDVFVSRLRKYLSEDTSITIRTVQGVGILFETGNQNP